MSRQTMNAAVFGATGRTGQLVMAELPFHGWKVRALARTPGKIQPRPGVEVVAGDARSADDVAAVLDGVQVAFSCLGMTDISVPATDFSDSVKLIVSTMERMGVRRLIAIASVAVLDDPSGGYRAKKLPPVLKYVADEHLRNLETLRSSSLDWTLMCPATLRSDITPGHRKIAYDELAGSSDMTAYADLAQTMIELVDDEASYRKRVCVLSEPA